MLVCLLIITNFVFFSSCTAAPVRLYGRFALVRRLRGGGDSTNDDNNQDTTTNSSFTLLQVQIIHRHGDRTPITPLTNEDYWHSTLPPPHVLKQISKGIRLKRTKDADAGEKHDAQGKPPFGQLTALGLYQMVQLGTKLRDELVQEDDDTTTTTTKLFTKEQPLHPKRIKARSTDFPRTIQSLQALLVGLFPNGMSWNTNHTTTNTTNDEDTIFLEIDLQQSKFHIPDPQPRHTKQQEILERQLALRNHIIQKDIEMSSLAIQVTNELIAQNIIQVQEAQRISSGFHVGSTSTLSPNYNDESITVLPWAQLAEITKCLRVHNLLPSTITHDEQELIVQHASWKWYETMRPTKLSKLAMHTMMTDLVTNMNQKQMCDDDEQEDALLHIYSAHDSTLIALLCAFQLHPPPHWPDYASYLKIELLAKNESSSERVVHENSNTTTHTTSTTVSTNVSYYVRFSLNGSILPCAIGQTNKEEALDMIPLEQLYEYIQDVSHLNTNDPEERMESTSTTE